MVSGDNQSEWTNDGERCGCCQHSVDVRGMEHIVCLAFLVMRHPEHDGGCTEFEFKRIKVPSVF